MANLWNQIFSRRFTWVVLCTLMLGFALVSYSAYVASRDDSTKGDVQMTTATARELPLIDQVEVEHTELALFALG